MKIEKWAEKRSQLPATAATIIASNSETYCQLAKLFKNREVFDGTFTLPSLSQWLSLYRNHRSVISVMTELQSSFGEYGQKANDLLDLIDEPQDPKKDKASSLAEIHDGVDQWSKETRARVEALLEGKDPFPNDPPSAFYQKPEISFLILVYSPCWVLYREPPAKLLRKARLGGVDDIARLVQVDPSAIFDKKVSEHVHALRATNNPHEYVQIVNALQKPPKGKITRQRIKTILAGYISASFQRYGEPITEPEIRALFDAVAYDKSHGEIEIDTDLPNSPEAFSQAILRERKIWMKLYPDKK